TVIGSLAGRFFCGARGKCCLTADFFDISGDTGGTDKKGSGDWALVGTAIKSEKAIARRPNVCAYRLMDGGSRRAASMPRVPPEDCALPHARTTSAPWSCRPKRRCRSHT